MRLKALFDFPPWLRGEVFEIDDALAQALIAANYAHFEVIPDAPSLAAAIVEEHELDVKAFDKPPADKMVRKPKGRK